MVLCLSEVSQCLKAVNEKRASNYTSQGMAAKTSLKRPNWLFTMAKDRALHTLDPTRPGPLSYQNAVWDGDADAGQPPTS